MGGGGSKSTSVEMLNSVMTEIAVNAINKSVNKVSQSVSHNQEININALGGCSVTNVSISSTDEGSVNFSSLTDSKTDIVNNIVNQIQAKINNAQDSNNPVNQAFQSVFGGGDVSSDTKVTSDITTKFNDSITNIQEQVANQSITGNQKININCIGNSVVDKISIDSIGKYGMAVASNFSNAFSSNTDVGNKISDDIKNSQKNFFSGILDSLGGWGNILIILAVIAVVGLAIVAFFKFSASKKQNVQYPPIPQPMPLSPSPYVTRPPRPRTY